MEACTAALNNLARALLQHPTASAQNVRNNTFRDERQRRSIRTPTRLASVACKSKHRRDDCDVLFVPEAVDTPADSSFASREPHLLGDPSPFALRFIGIQTIYFHPSNCVRGSSLRSCSLRQHRQVALSAVKCDIKVTARRAVRAMVRFTDS